MGPGQGDEEIKPLPDANQFDLSPVANTPSNYENPFADVPLSSDPNPHRTPNATSMPTATPPNPRATVAPGICLIAFASCCTVLMGLGIVEGIRSVVEQDVQVDDVFAFIFLGITLVVQLLILWGGINMVRRRGYTMALVGAITSIIPISACWCLSLPFGVWALATLLKSGMRTVFYSEENR